MANPRALRGPQCLLFYGCLGVAVTALVWWTRRAWERADTPARPLSDYLEIAFLRGGSAEAIRVAVITLIDRGVLAISGSDSVKVAQADAARRLTRRTEKAIATAPRDGDAAAALVRHGRHRRVASNASRNWCGGAAAVRRSAGGAAALFLQAGGALAWWRA